MMYKKLTASGDLSMPIGTRVYGVRLESVSDDCSAILYDEATQALGASENREVCKLLVTTPVKPDSNDIHPSSDKQSFGPNGITFSKGLSITLAGTTARVFVYYA